MTREEILEKARKENKGVDEVKRQVELQARSISRCIGLVMCMVLNLLEAIFANTQVVGQACWTIYGSVICSETWVYALRLKSKSWLFGAVCVTIFLAAMFYFTVKAMI